jgi:5-carboxyvanillate decarboxylase
MTRFPATADPAEPDQEFWGFVFTEDTPGPRRVRRQLLDLEDERLQIMDANGVDVQLLSLTAPGVQTFPPAEGAALARLANDRLAELIGKHPGRFAGLAAVVPQDPRSAAAEIDRAVTDLRLNGVIINSHTGSEYLDEEKYWPLLEAAESLGAPIYLHPRSPAAQMAAAFKKYGLETGIWGFQADTGLRGLRLICAGVFDRFPALKIVLGHLGEGCRTGRTGSTACTRCAPRTVRAPPCR